MPEQNGYPADKVGRSGSGALAGSVPKAGYSAAAKLLHWIVALLVFSQYVISILMPGIGPHTVSGTLIDLHFSFGVVILVVMAIRFVYRLLEPVPLDMPDAPGWGALGRPCDTPAFLFLLSARTVPGMGVGIGAPASRECVRYCHVAEHRGTQGALGAGRGHAASVHDVDAARAGRLWTRWQALYHHFVRHDGASRRMLPTSV